MPGTFAGAIAADKGWSLPQIYLGLTLAMLMIGHLMRGIRETFMTTLNLGNLATFRLVVQRGSFSAAADALGISQPAVSLQVRQLEQFLQTRLLERTGRGIKATAAGMALLAPSEQIDRGAIHRPIDLLAVGQQCHSRRRRLDPTSGSLQQPGL